MVTVLCKPICAVYGIIAYIKTNNYNNFNSICFLWHEFILFKEGHDFTEEQIVVMDAADAFKYSQSEAVHADFYIPGMTWGRGMWPSWQTATYLGYIRSLYNSLSPKYINLGSLYGLAFQYADKVLNAGKYTGSIDQQISDPSSLDRYFEALSKGANKLNFTFYVPAIYGSLEKVKIPNVEETDDPEKIWTVHFDGGREIW